MKTPNQYINQLSKLVGGFYNALVEPVDTTLQPIEDNLEDIADNLWNYILDNTNCVDGDAEYVSMEPNLPIVDELLESDNDEADLYFYHPDHLGSSSFISDVSGNVNQHLQYLPFGECFIDQRTNHEIRYTFSGKEKDTETGYNYFGARYYASDLSVWLSVDPLADKYPSMSSFMYCAGNPVMLVDPDGKFYKPYLLFNGKHNELSIYDDNDTPDDYSDDIFIGTFKAHNKVDRKSKGKWQDGFYEMEDKNKRHTHTNRFEKDGKTPQDSKKGRYGKGGIYRAKSFVESFTKKLRSGMAVHAGRENKPFFKRLTMGCIRTTSDAMIAIDKAIKNYGSLTKIIIQENRKSASSSLANEIKPGNNNLFILPINEPDALKVEIRKIP